MLRAGTAKRSKAEFAQEIEAMGARLGGRHDRERSWHTLTVHKNDVGRAVELLGDAYSNANLDASELELEKERQRQNADNRDLRDVSIE